MNDKFDELAKGMAQSVTQVLLCLAILAPRACPVRAAELYVDAAAANGGDGSATHPLRRITDAVAQARRDRQNLVIPTDERIQIHVAPGAYPGSKEPSVLARNPSHECLPILLNVSNLTLIGSTVLTPDETGLPAGVQTGTDTLLCTPDYYSSRGQSLILLCRTTDGMAGDNVTVTGFHLDQPSDKAHLGAEILPDRVSGFVIRGNLFTHTDSSIYSTRSSGIIESNLMLLDSFGGVIKGGSLAHPAQVLVQGNRAQNVGGGFVVEASGQPPQIDVGANKVELEPLPTAAVREDAPFRLDVTLIGNDLSRNAVWGLRCGFYNPNPKTYTRLETQNPLVPILNVTATGNLLNMNGLYGLIVDTLYPYPSDKSALTARFTGIFQNNSLIGNGRATSFFCFNEYSSSLAGSAYKYLQQATYEVSDIDGELTGFDYDNPFADPSSGAVLDNTLIVNGTVIPAGTKITPEFH